MYCSKEEINYQKIGKKFKELRKRQGKTQKEVAAALDMEYGSYSNYERGAEHLPLWRIIQLCVYFQVSPGRILNDCASGLLPAWSLGEDDSSLVRKDEFTSMLEELRVECYKLPLEQLQLLLFIAKHMNQQKAEHSRKKAMI